jgi:hypothetical protein
MMLLPARKPKKITDKLKKMKENNEEIFIDGTERLIQTLIWLLRMLILSNTGKAMHEMK